MARVRVSVPVTVNSFGSGVDSVALALRLYEEIDLEDADTGFAVEHRGECQFTVREQAAKALRAFCHETGRAPSGLRLSLNCEGLPAQGFGLDTGLLLGCGIAANALYGGILTRDDLLNLAIRSGGAGPSACAALLGNLAVAGGVSGRTLHTIVQIPPQEVVVIAKVSGSVDAQQPVGHGSQAQPDGALTALLVEALRSGDHALVRGLAEHLLEEHWVSTTFRAAAQAAHSEGASGVFVHELGDSAIAFARSKHERIAQVMTDAFEQAQVGTAVWIVPVETHGISIDAVDIPPGETQSLPVAASPHRIQS